MGKNSHLFRKTLMDVTVFICMILCAGCFSTSGKKRISLEAPLPLPKRSIEKDRNERIKQTSSFRCLLAKTHSSAEKSVQRKEITEIKNIAARLNLTPVFIEVDSVQIPAYLRSGKADIAAGNFTMDQILSNGMRPVFQHGTGSIQRWFMEAPDSLWHE